jgi:hypothetical protein
MAAMLPAKRKRLTGRPPREQVQLPFILGEVYMADVPLMQVPGCYRLDSTMFVVPNRIATGAIPLNDLDMPKSYSSNTQAQTANPYE